MGAALATKIFSYLMLGSVMIGTEHDILTKFLKMTPLTFVGFEMVDAFEFLVDIIKGFIK